MKQADEIYYFYRRLVRSAKKEGDKIIITITKQQLISPYLKECIQRGYFSHTKQHTSLIQRLKDLLSSKDKKKQILFKCDDGDLFFNEEECNVLLENYKLLKKHKIKLSFVENLDYKYSSSISRRDNKLVYYDIIHKKVERTFEEILEVNTKLTKMAKKINEGFIDSNGQKQQLSPFEKYLLCFQIVSNIKYYCPKYETIRKNSHSFVTTIKANKGCCVGKAEYLRALLSMVGINACTVTVDNHRSHKLNLEYLIRISYDTLFESGTNTNERIHKIFEIINRLNYKEEIKQSTRCINKDMYSKEFYTDHAINLTNINDEKYGVKGIFAGDSTGNIECTANIPIGDLHELLNFGSYFYSGANIIDFIKDIPETKPLSEREEDAIEEEYLRFVKYMLRNDAEKMLEDNPLKKQFLDKLEECKSFFEMKTLFDEYRFDKDVLKGKEQEYAQDYEEAFERFMDNGNEHLLHTLEAIEARIGLEAVPLADDIPYDKLLEASKLVEEIYNENFANEKVDNVQV